MGFTSWNCPGCDHSVRHPGATNRKSSWMADAVAIFPNGDRTSGTYDGYGRIEGKGRTTELEIDQNFALYHQACWTILGKPEYWKPSESARDQGHFVGTYDPVQPRTREDLDRMKRSGK